MNRQIVYIAMYRALECVEQETKNAELSIYLDGANPYVYKDRKSADPLFFKEFNNWIDECKIELDDNNSFDIIKQYLLEKTKFGGILNDISAEEWNSLISIVRTEEPELA